MKKKILLSLVAALAVGGATAAYASPTLTYYSFGPVSGGTSTYYGSSTFSVTNSYHIVTITGWQTTQRYPNSNADVYYSIVQKGVFSDTYYGENEVKGQYTQAGTWFSTQFSNVPYISGASVRIDPVSSDTTQGAGNAYDGY